MADLGVARLSRRRVVITATGTLVLLGCGIAAYASTNSGGSRYRTAVAGPARIDATLQEVGKATAASPKTYAFTTSGTVATLGVKVGDEVAAGQGLATLDPTALNNSLAQAQQTLANAKLTLENDETGKTSNNSSSTRSGVSLTAYEATPSDSTPAGGVGGSNLTAAQKAVTDAQHVVDTDLAAQKTLFDDATAICGDSTKTAPDCTTAQQAVLDAQDKTGTDEAALLTAEQQLSTLLAQQASASQSNNGEDKSGNGRTTPTTPTAKPASAAQLAADQAAIDAAAAAVNVAAENLSRATLVAMTSGTVMSIGLRVGSSVSANSTTATIVLADPTTYSYAITVPVAALTNLNVGDVSSIVPDGTSKKLAGKVVAIGLAPTTSGGSSYAVTVGLDEQPTGLRDGSTASVTITTSTEQSAVSVPTSALTRNGTVYTVRTLVNGKATSKTVQVGVSGATLTQVISGVQDGDVVVIADRHEKLPSSQTNNRLGNRTGLGGVTLGGVTLGGGGLGGGGFAARS